VTTAGEILGIKVLDHVIIGEGQYFSFSEKGWFELVNAWHADHVYKHHPRAIEAFCLVAYLAYNLFHAFLALNVKPQLRRTKTEAFWAHVLKAEIYVDAANSRTARPP
jgi:hypothetical protein